MGDLLVVSRWSGLAISLVGSALFPLSFVVLLLSNDFTGAILFASLYGVASGITAVARATLPLQLFPPDAYARASARMAVPLNFAFATAPPVFTAIMTSASPQAALWLALVISVFAFLTLLGLSLRHGRGI
jgi:predicted MFS family arabinose efflux permease